jgi:hypothetical protein
MRHALRTIAISCAHQNDAIVINANVHFPLSHIFQKLRKLRRREHAFRRTQHQFTVRGLLPRIDGEGVARMSVAHGHINPSQYGIECVPLFSIGIE